MELSFINVGYGEAILLRCYAQGQAPFTMLIDGGSGEDQEYAGGTHRMRARDYLRAHGIERIDLLLNTHIHEDHTSGLPLIVDEFPVDTFWCALPWDDRWEPLHENLATSSSTRKYLRSLNDAAYIRRILLSRGAHIQVMEHTQPPVRPYPGLTIEILGPQRESALAFSRQLCKLHEPGALQEKQALLAQLDARMNNYSVITRISYKGRRILLVGDTNLTGYDGLADIRADVFKLGHHGQGDSVTEDILRRINPEIAVICASSDRRYESSHPVVFERLENLAQERKHPVRTLISDVPILPPYTDHMQPHNAVTVCIGDDGSMDIKEA